MTVRIFEKQGIKTENDDSMVQDSEMAEHSALPSDEEDDDGEDHEGAENDEGGDTPDADGSINRDLDQDHEMQDSDAPGSVVHSSTGETDEEDAASKPRFPPPALGSLVPLHGPLHLNSPRIEGSPLKHVMIQSPTDPSPMASPHIMSAGASFSATSYMEVHSVTATSHGSATTVSEGHMVTGMDFQMSSRPNRIEELANVGGAFSTTPTVEISGAPPLPQDASPQGESHSDAALDPPKSPALRPAVTADEDDGLNLLGSLERELDRQEGMSNAGSNAGSEQKPTPPAGAGPATKEESPVVKEEEIN